MTPDAAHTFRRSPHNPILTAEDFSASAHAAFNPGACRFAGEVLLLVRVEDRTGMSNLVVATSADGVGEWQVHPERGITARHDTYEERWGVEDPRITRIGDTYYIAYTGYSEGGPLVCLASTTDFTNFDRHGVLQSPDDKDAALFPVQFDGQWALIHRPAPTISDSRGAHMLISFSTDLHHWGDTKVLLAARTGGWWDANKIGLGPPPLLTEAGWLICYHGVRVTASGSLYRVGLALVDRDDPCRVLARGDEWVFGPEAEYEIVGDVPGAVFPCGWTLEDDGDTVNVYYGAADTVVGLATTSVRAMLAYLATQPAPDSMEPVR